ncbi:tetratricopeptide repeat protein [Bacillus carboniphilus]|uniref:Tetratricopeptide repeat protein n=1 Tax=Bacillus carboniphilus TaxID=86663 RepID=A0ABY9JQN6_9BACI|nr:tetratricopeptide repeat protein [Bacillus carboniphilus]WLR41710.1 tetratricopeptide repeat protein [Bacillus carboniphilus]
MDNAFISALLHIKETDHLSSIWTRGVCRTIQYQIPFHLGQVLEPSTLIEASKVIPIDTRHLMNLEYETDGPMLKIKQEIENSSSLSSLERLILSYRLTYLARFDLAASMHSLVDINKLTAEEQIRHYLLKFVLLNRQDQTNNVEEFTKMKNLFESHLLPNYLFLTIASNAIVWELKKKSIGESLFNWFVEKGFNIVDDMGDGKTFTDHIALSQFFRAYAMIPAESLKINETREAMKKSLYFAELADPKNDWEEYRKSDAIKTIYESEIKEHIFVSKNLEEAEKSGHHLLKLDPNWSISYHEMADVYFAKNEIEKALNMFEKSLEVGLPRLVFTQYMIGYCLGTLQREEEAIEAFKKTLNLDPNNISSGINGYNLARKMNHSTEGYFKSILDEWTHKGILNEEHKEYIHS